MIVFEVSSLPKIPYIHHIYIILANPGYNCIYTCMMARNVCKPFESQLISIRSMSASDQCLHLVSIRSASDQCLPTAESQLISINIRMNISAPKSVPVSVSAQYRINFSISVSRYRHQLINIRTFQFSNHFLKCKI